MSSFSAAGEDPSPDGNGSDEDAAASADSAELGEPVMTSLLAKVSLLAREIGIGDDIHALLQSVADAVTRHTPWPMCWTGLLDLATPQVIAAFHAGYDPCVTPDFDQWPAEGSPSVHALTSGEILTIPDVSKAKQFPYVRQQAVRAGWRSAVIVPVPVAGHCGVIFLCRPDVHQFTEAELSLARMIASLTTVAFPGMARPTREAEALRRVSALQDRLLHLQVHGASLTDLCRSVSSLVGMQTLVLDRFARPLGSAGLTSAEVDELTAGFIATDRTVDHGVVHAELGERSAIVGHAVDGNNERVASLVALLPEHDGSTFDPSALLELASMHVALSVIKQRTAIQSEVRLREEFGEALASDGASAPALSRSAALLGIDLTSANRVMRVHPSGLHRPLSPNDAFDVADILTRRLADQEITAVVCPVGASDFAVVTHEPARTAGVSATRIVRESLRSALATRPGASAMGVRMAIGLGDPAVGVDGLVQSHDEALRALEVARTIDGDDGERSIGEVGSFAVLSAVAESDREILVRRYLRPLLAYDSEHGGECIETLTAYFETVGNVQRTADKLFLHLSTVRYRLKRIEEIACISLRDEEDRLCLQLALRLAQITGPSAGS